MPAMSQKEKNVYSRLYRLIRNEEWSLWRELLVFVFTISVFSFLLPLNLDCCASEPVVEIPDVQATFLSFFCGSRISHCCLNISVRYICVDTWNANIASYRKITLLWDCLYLFQKTCCCVLQHIFVIQRNFNCGTFLLKGKTKQKTNKTPKLDLLVMNLKN